MAKDETPPAASDADAKAKPISPAARGANAQAQSQSIQLDTITVQSKKRARQRTAPAAAPIAPPPAAPVVTTNAGGDIGYHANSTSTATKTNTPLRDIPQSITVITKQQVQDIGAQRIEDAVRYVPGVNWHQGEGNRDQIVIRGQSSTADFFVNGMRDDAQIYRDLYNTERLEFLKGPNAMIFGRGGGGGVLEPRAQGSRWRSDQRVEGPDRFLQQRAGVRRRRRQDHRQCLRTDQRRVRGHRHLSRLHAICSAAASIRR